MKQKQNKVGISKLSPVGDLGGASLQGQRMSPPLDFENRYSLSKRIILLNFSGNNSKYPYSERIFISS